MPWTCTRLALLLGLGVSEALAGTPDFPSEKELPVGTGAEDFSFLGLDILTYPGFFGFSLFLLGAWWLTF